MQIGIVTWPCGPSQEVQLTAMSYTIHKPVCSCAGEGTLRAYRLFLWGGGDYWVKGMFFTEKGL